MTDITEQEIKGFFELLDSRLEEKKKILKHYSKILAPEFNLFNLWYDHFDENRVSKIIAFFLDPKESHSQGKLFLKEFLKEIYNDENENNVDELLNCNEVMVSTEHKTDTVRYIDILLEFNNCWTKGKYIIAIENKLYLSTEDQSAQLKDYIEYLGSKVKENFTMVYLAPREKTISEESLPEEDKNKFIESGKLKTISYEDNIIPWLHRCMLFSEADKVRFFLKDFEIILRKEYLKEAFMGANETIMDFILSNEKYLQLALEIDQVLTEEIWNSTDERILKAKFGMILDDIIIEDKDLEIEKRKLYKSKNIITYLLEPKFWKQHYIAFSFEQKKLLLFGIKRKKEDKNKTKVSRLEEYLKKQFPEKTWKVSEWFLAYSTYKDFSSKEDLIFWSKVYKKDENLKEEIKEYIRKLKDYREASL